MAVDVVVPEVGEVGMDVTFAGWHRRDGETVRAGDVLFALDTAKSIVEVQAFADGILVELSVAEGDIVSPHQVVARLLESGDAEAGHADSASGTDIAATARLTSSVDGGTVEGGDRATDGARALAAPPPSLPVPGAGASSVAAVTASPRARRAARSASVDLAQVRGTGPDGLVTERDVERQLQERLGLPGARAGVPESHASGDVQAAAAGGVSAGQVAVPGSAAPGGASESISGSTAEKVGSSGRGERARQAMAELTKRSWSEIPQFSLFCDVDVEDSLGSARPTALVVVATARALARHPECNLAWEGATLASRPSIDLGLLVDTDDGLRQVTLRDADRLDLGSASEAIAAATARARAGHLGDGDVAPRSLTISNLGMYSVDRFTALVVPPDPIVLAVGRVRLLPRWDGSAFLARRSLSLTLSVDHRAISGAGAARLLTSLESLIASPGRLLVT